MNDKIELAIKIALNAHKGQVDKAGEPYILHPLRVMDRCTGHEAKIVAVLHDVVEDTHIGLEDLLKAGIPYECVEAIDSISRRGGELYFDYINRVKTNPIAIHVKLIDLMDNANLSRLNVIRKRDEKRLHKYQKAINILSDR